MENLAATGHAITAVHEELLNRWRRGFCFIAIASVEIGSCFEGIRAGEQAGARGTTLRRVAVSLREKHAAGSVPASLRDAVRKNVQAPATNEFHSRQFDFFDLITAAVRGSLFSR